ncbi:unnamed protein product [Somion occarium]|uniref:Homeobox domain-containing protein n=2 Tax=Somion occarium TaxID=3059160 RepID=A0ABP1D4W0_9APHY
MLGSPKPNPPPNSSYNSNDSFPTHTRLDFSSSKSSSPLSQHHLTHQPTLEQQSPVSSPSSQHTDQNSPVSEEPVADMEQKGDKGKGVSRSSPSDSSSQGDMADTEMEAGPSQPTEEEQPPPPPKKKRTRTLTTPQQAAVLHALLAQSRFPTTAMREEVGRSIGLSARKVQIWFQNQRQKARRPRGHNAPPLTRPPQYGPYTNVPLASIAETSATASSSVQQTTNTLGAEQRMITGPTGESRSYNAPLGASWSAGADFYTQRETYSSEAHRRRSSLPQLSGPGVPGSGVGIPGRTSTSQELTESQFTTAQSSDIHRRRRQTEGDFPIVLPPLRIHRSPSPAAQSAPVQSLSSGFPAAARLAPLSSAPAVLPSPGVPGEPSSLRPVQSPTAPTHIPPPFTLEPRPLWDDSVFSPFSRPHASPYEPRSSPTHYQPTSAPIQPTFQLPSLTNLRLHEGSADSQVTLPPIRTRGDNVRSASSSTQGALPGPSASRSYSRTHDRDPSGHHDPSR